MFIFLLYQLSPPHIPCFRVVGIERHVANPPCEGALLLSALVTLSSAYSNQLAASRMPLRQCYHRIYTVSTPNHYLDTETVALACKRLAIPAHVGSGHVKKVDVDSCGIDTVGLQKIRHRCRNGSIRFHANGANAVHATQRRGRVTPGENDVGLVIDGNSYGSRFYGDREEHSNNNNNNNNETMLFYPVPVCTARERLEKEWNQSAFGQLLYRIWVCFTHLSFA
jgi:hypothetical protein